MTTATSQDLVTPAAIHFEPSNALAQEYKTKGNKALLNKQFDNAILWYSKGLELEPNNAILLCNRASAYCNAKIFDMSLQDASKAICVAPKYAKAYHRKAHVLYFGYNFTRDALYFVQQCLALDTENESAKKLQAQLVDALAKKKKKKKKDDDDVFSDYYCESDDDHEMGMDSEEDNTGDTDFAQHAFRKSQMISFSGGQDAWSQKWQVVMSRMEKRLQESKPFVAEYLQNCSYILHIKLRNLRVPTPQGSKRIWRRIRVPGSTTFDVLHDKILCPVLGWARNYHAYGFQKWPVDYAEKFSPVDKEHGVVIGGINSRSNDSMHRNIKGIYVLDDRKYCLADLMYNVHDKMEYLYDFGDNFSHVITVEQIEAPSKANKDVIQCLAGELACPPEDCGSILQYSKILPILLNPMHAKHDQQWHESQNAANYKTKKFDPLEFNLKYAQKHLAQVLQSPLSNHTEHTNLHNFSVLAGKSNTPKWKESQFVKPKKVCAVCNKENVDLKVCSRCKIVYYCSAECQTQDWPKHKEKCCKAK